jgi:hypothetical protein
MKAAITFAFGLGALALAALMGVGHHGHDADCRRRGGVQ